MADPWMLDSSNFPLAYGMAGGMSPEVQQMMRNRMLMTAGARMLGGAAQGEKTAQSIGASAMAGMDATDQLLNQGLRAQMQNRQMGINEGKYGMLSDQEADNIKASQDYLANIRAKGREPTSLELLNANAIRNGQAGYVAGNILRNSFGAGLLGAAGMDTAGVPPTEGEDGETGPRWFERLMDLYGKADQKVRDNPALNWLENLGSNLGAEGRETVLGTGKGIYDWMMGYPSTSQQMELEALRNPMLGGAPAPAGPVVPARTVNPMQGTIDRPLQPGAAITVTPEQRRKWLEEQRNAR